MFNSPPSAAKSALFRVLGEHLENIRYAHIGNAAFSQRIKPVKTLLGGLRR